MGFFYSIEMKFDGMSKYCDGYISSSRPSIATSDKLFGSCGAIKVAEEHGENFEKQYYRP